MSWQTWGYGPVHVPYDYTFPFQASADSIRIRTEEWKDPQGHKTSLRFQIFAEFPGYGPNASEILRYEITVSDESHLPPQHELQDLFGTVARSAASYAAAHMLSNIAAIISRYPMSQEAKDQIISALVMALPNFDDSEQVKSPVGRVLVRTRAEFLHAARTAFFANDSREYITKNTSPYDTTEIKRRMK